MYSALTIINTMIEVPLSKAPNSINGCPLLRVCVHSVCVLGMRGWRLYPRALHMIRGLGGSGNKKMHSDYVRVDKINY